MKLRLLHASFYNTVLLEFVFTKYEPIQSIYITFMCANVLLYKQQRVGQQSLRRALSDRGSPGVDMVNDAFKRALVS